MRTLGIDPGTATIGVGVVDELNDGSLQAVHHDVITTSPKSPMYERLQIVFSGISALVDEFQPDRAAVEELFFAKNVTTAITVAQGRGVILLALAEADMLITEYKPNEVKQAVAGYGGAKKPQMQEMVRMLLGLSEIPKPEDAADALAIAITDLHSARFNALY